VSAHKRNPRGQNCLYKREVEHINNPAVKPRGIAAAFGHKSRHMPVTIVEQRTVAHAINNIAECAGKYERQANDKTKLKIAPYELENKPPQRTDYNYSENRKYVCIKQFYTESHTRVFGEIDFEP